MRLRPAFAALAMAGLCAVATPALAQPEADVAGRAGAPDEAPDIDAQRKALAEEIRALRGQLADLDDADPTAKRTASDLQLLERLDGLYLRWQEQLGRSEELQRRREEIEQRIASGFEAVVGQPPPYTISLLDSLEENWQGTSAREADLEELARTAEEGFEQARAALAEKEQKRRELLESESDAAGPVEAEGHAHELARALLEIRLAKVQIRLARTERDNARDEFELFRLQNSVRDETLEWVRGRLHFDPADLEHTVEQFDKRERDSREALDRAKVGLATAERTLVAAQDQLDPADPGDAAKLEARRLTRQAARRRVAELDGRLARLPELRELAEKRHRLLAGELQRAEIRSSETRAEELIGELERAVRVAQGRIVELSRRSVETLRRAEASASSREARWLRRQDEALEERVSLYRGELEELDAALTLARRAAADFERHTRVVSFVDLFEDSRDGLANVWATELMVVDDRSVTIGKVLSALGLFALGFVASRLASRLLRRLLARTLGMDSGAAVAFQGLTFYVLLTVFFLLSLRTVGIPLTAFTLLGGGIAIGVGFGSQNIVNNFISGLILMLERPIKVGDIVDVDGTFGHIEHIGARSTRVRTFDNIHIIVPNSSFLEQNVVNWTLSDNLVRTHVDVGVAYGSPTRDVDRLIQRALADHGKVIDDPAPVVLFTDFGDNALTFRAYFWLQMRVMMDRRRVESDVRHRIDRLFRDAGITIAFPQRDVHLDVQAPLEVRWRKADDEPESG